MSLGIALYRTGDWKEALSALNLVWGPEQRIGPFYVAMAYWKLGDRARARQEYDRAVEMFSRHVGALRRSRGDQGFPYELHRVRLEAATLLGLAREEPAQDNRKP